MKKYRIGKLCMAVCLSLGMMLAPMGALKAQAAEIIATVNGTVMSGTTTELLKLSTSDGNMEIKLGSNTDTSSCKILLPGKNINVSVSHGSDGYLHAEKITTGKKETSVSVDSSSAATVTGTINSKTTSDVLYFDTKYGQMEIKLDTTTDMSGCTVLVADKTYSIVCARGSDAYMHALSISDSASGSSSSSGVVNNGLTPAPSGSISSELTVSSVTGTVNGKTTEELLYLDTKDGQMQIKIDSMTDSRSAVMLMPNKKLTVSFYHGSDEYLHAAKLSTSKEAMEEVQVDTSSTSDVTGTVNSKTTENILYLDTAHGQMELKLDKVSSISNCKVLISGKKVNVNCARGEDAYMHALTIVGA